MNYASKTYFLEYYKREFIYTLNVVEAQIIEKRYKDKNYLINEFNHNHKTINQIAIENNVADNTVMNWVLKNNLNESLRKIQIKRYMKPEPKKVKLKRNNKELLKQYPTEMEIIQVEGLTDNFKSRLKIMSEIKRSNYTDFGYLH